MARSILNCYKTLIRYSLMFQAIIKNPDKYYNYAYDVLNILEVSEVKQTNINYNKAIELILFTIEFLETNYITTKEKIYLIY